MSDEGANYCWEFMIFSELIGLFCPLPYVVVQKEEQKDPEYIWRAPYMYE